MKSSAAKISAIVIVTVATVLTCALARTIHWTPEPVEAIPGPPAATIDVVDDVEIAVDAAARLEHEAELK